MKQAKLKAREGLSIRDPQTFEILQGGGELKPLNTYWLRRLTEGDVVQEAQEITERIAVQDHLSKEVTPEKETPKRRKS